MARANAACPVRPSANGPCDGHGQLSRPPCGGGPGWGVARYLDRKFVRARSQSDKLHVNRLEHAIEVVKNMVIREAQNVIASVRRARPSVAGVETRTLAVC